MARKKKTDEDGEAASSKKTKKKKSKIRTLFKWTRRISVVAGIVGAVRKYQMEQNEAKQPPGA